MDILQTDNGKKGFFYVKEGEEILAKMVYVWAGSDRIIIEHTEVDERLRGKGAGRQMVDAAVRFARERNVKIVPLCPFARSVFNKVPTYSDVL